MKLKTPAFWCSWKNQKLGLQGVWISAGQQVVMSPGATVLHGSHFALERTSGLLALETDSSHVRFTSPGSCHRGQAKGTHV